MRCRAIGRIVVTALPVIGRLANVLVFPPRFVVRCEPNIREYRIVVNHVERVLVGLLVCTRNNAEKARFRVNRT